MAWPAWLWIGTRLKFSVWLANRAATSTSLLVLWKRLKSRRRFWFYFVLINLCSISVLVLILFWLR